MAHFFDLPAELRNRIYILVLVNSETLAIKRKPASHSTGHLGALTRTSRQLRSETLPVYYSANHFFFERCCQARLFQAWLEAKPAAIPYIKHLKLHKVDIRSHRGKPTGLRIWLEGCKFCILVEVGSRLTYSPTKLDFSTSGEKMVRCALYEQAMQLVQAYEDVAGRMMVTGRVDQAVVDKAGVPACRWVYP